MRFTVQAWPRGGYVIVPHRQPPFPAIFATRAQALTYADALAATPLVEHDADTRGRWAEDHPAVGAPSAPPGADDCADATGRHAPRRFSRGAVAEEQARRAGLTPRQYHLLRAVREHPAYPAVTITALAAHLCIHHQSASRRVAHAVARGLLHQSPTAASPWCP